MLSIVAALSRSLRISLTLAVLAIRAWCLSLHFQVVLRSLRRLSTKEVNERKLLFIKASLFRRIIVPVYNRHCHFDCSFRSLYAMIKVATVKDRGIYFPNFRQNFVFSTILECICNTAKLRSITKIPILMQVLKQ